VRLHRAKREYGCQINIAPLIDVVFLLIIFFLTVSHITQVRVEALDVAAVTLCGLALSVLATIFPAFQASKVDPIEAVRTHG